ncbi:hypothetical protein [Nocardioides hwasunensis]|uniref:Uncharacterized protein n=1 Tax=Nocardioides hwasunensis TaxID=397258 RepID=A0ABR8MEC5_9ACTN|nr:hypothetical protein [Nocardioides hwasunensis]MBD3914223.1 hypothetical protein [Nocardioides hwasunensis]
MQDVEWTPPGGTPRTIGVCAADGRRLLAGEEPEVRMVRVGDRWMPCHEAGGVPAAVQISDRNAGQGGFGI